MMGADDTDPDANSNEKPRHLRVIQKGFYLGRTPVTVKQFTRLASYRSCEFAAFRSDHAVNFISCLEAEEWIARMNAARPPDETNITYRLPTEAEWEYACRSGSSTRFYYGDDAKYEFLSDYAWFAKNTWDLGSKHPHPVGRKRPNAFGLYDMHGNVWEWTSDGWAMYDDIIKRGDHLRDSSLRVLRGGGWCHDPCFLRSSDRDSYKPEYRHYYTGFRVCCSGDAPFSKRSEIDE